MLALREVDSDHTSIAFYSRWPALHVASVADRLDIHLIGFVSMVVFAGWFAAVHACD